MRWFFMAALVPVAGGLLVAAAEESHHWSYSGENGPPHWGAVCETGKAQSPIDIRSTEVPQRTLPPLEFHYGPGALHIVDNGHSIQVRVPEGSTLSVGSDRFDLVQFHFHKPSEEMIDGRHFDMVVHLVHKDAAGKLAVVAVPLSLGADNPAIAAIWRHFPAERGREASPAGIMFDPSRLLPANRAYFTYPGSLTTPPCTEGVRWFVLRSPQSISPAELRAFGNIYPANARPVQPVNGRQVLASD
jgi:carbonic anhydrase